MFRLYISGKHILSMLDILSFVMISSRQRGDGFWKLRQQTVTLLITRKRTVKVEYDIEK